MRTCRNKFFSLFSILFAIQSIAAEPVRFAVIDSPVDHDHEEIAPYIDLAMMEKLVANEDESDESPSASWKELNDKARAEYLRRLDPKRLEQAKKFIDALGRMMGDYDSLSNDQQVKILGPAIGGGILYFLSRKFRKEVDLVGQYLHGTHVAGVAIGGDKDLRMLNFPMITAPGEDTTSFFEHWNFNPEGERIKLRTYFTDLFASLKKANVKVVNMSLGVTVKDTLKSLRKRTGLLTKSLLYFGLKRNAEATARIYEEEMTKAMAAHPEMVFVLAAGNDNSLVNDADYDFASINLPNVIQVAAVDKKGARAIFSNHSAEFVEVAAHGQGVKGPQADGGSIHLMGTSMAAPLVTLRLNKIFKRNPDLSAKQALDQLLEIYSVRSVELKKYVQDGRLLPAVASSENSVLAELEISLEHFGALLQERMRGQAEDKYQSTFDATLLEVQQNTLLNTRELAAALRAGLLELSVRLPERLSQGQALTLRLSGPDLPARTLSCESISTPTHIRFNRAS